MRDLLLRSLVWYGAFAVILTESLSAIHMLRPAPVALAWLLALAVGYHRLSLPPRRISRDPVVLAIAGVIVVMTAAIALAAVLYPPNSADAMAYHLPRVVYWSQAASVSFFPTPYFNQIILQPMAEYVMLHTRLLTGGDYLINLIAWAAFVGCIVGVSAIAARLGLEARGQAFAALLCATLPNAILQASGAKNDLLLALWLVCAAYFALSGDALLLGLAVGLALATKATAYLFLPPLLLALGVWHRRQLAWIAAAVLLLNGPHYIRNLRLSGSPLGYDSAQGDGVFRWRNDPLGWRPLLSNLVRNTSEQLGARSAQWNQGVYDTALRIHSTLGLDPNHPSSTWPGARFAPPVNANHEANANNRWHLLLFVIAAVCAVRSRRWALYAAGLAGAFLLFCLYLKWQPFLARLEVPLFILAAPLGAWALDRPRPTWLAVLVCAFLAGGARLPLFQNWTRGLWGPNVAYEKTREDNYFNDMSQWNNRASYLDSVRLVSQSGCRIVGLDISENQLEYPFQALLPATVFEHTGVENASARYADSRAPHPCAVICPDCIGNQKKIAMYRDFGPPIEIGRFLLFMRGKLDAAR